MRQVVGATAKNHVAIKLNDQYKLPGAAGCKFTFGTNSARIIMRGRTIWGAASTA
jgi:hypothetical protein